MMLAQQRTTSNMPSNSPRIAPIPRRSKPSPSLRKSVLLSRHRPSLPPLYESSTLTPPAPSKQGPSCTPPTQQGSSKRTVEYETEKQMEISIIVTTWDDEGKCWYPVEVMGPIEQELKKHAERKRRERAERYLEYELSRERT